MRFTLALLLTVAACTAADRPNIVYILADDLGYGDVGCMNPDSKIPTPRLDSFAREGMRFTDAHASDSVCTPSRYGILTGRYCFRSRLKAGVLPPWGAPLIEAGRLTLPEFLRDNGYATACFGKWHLGWTWPTRDGAPPSSTDGLGNLDFSRPIAGGPTTRGFDTFFGVDLPNYPPYVFVSGDRTVGIPSVAAPLVKGGINRPGPMLPDWKLSAILPEVTRRAVEYVGAAAAAPKPFFLYLALTAPHYPIAPTEEFRGRSKAGDYGDYVVEVDAMVGRVLDALAAAGIADHTLVFFSSDNGPEVVEVSPAAYERVRLYGHYSMGVLRGAKRDTWEGGHRVPYLARWPGHIAAGVISNACVCELDLMATCAAVIDRPLPAGAAEDSWSILPALLGRTASHPPLILHAGNGRFGIRDGHWAYLDAKTGYGNGPKGQAPEWFDRMRGYAADPYPAELYDLRQDLSERRNLYPDHPDIVKRLKALLERYKQAGLASAGDTPSIPDE